MKISLLAFVGYVAITNAAGPPMGWNTEFVYGCN